MNVDIRSGDPRDLALLEVNARYMTHEQYQQLVDNIRRDGVLTSTPFVWHDVETGRREVLSGNHRVKAAVEAGLELISWLETVDPLTPQQRVAIQLSHNAIAGQDDISVLKQLYESIGDLDLREYAGLDDRTLELLAELDSVPLGEANLDFQTLSIVFLPADLEAARKVLDDALALAGSADQVWLAPLAHFDEVMRSLDAAGKAHDVTNVATSLGLVLEVFQAHAADLREGWWDADAQRAKHNGLVPLEAVLDTDAIPAKAAAALQRALDAELRRASAGGEGPRHRWQVLAEWAAQRLQQP
jgi:hypothetical protein